MDLHSKEKRNITLDDSTFMCQKFAMFRCFNDSLQIKWEYRDSDKGKTPKGGIIKENNSIFFMTRTRAELNQKDSGVKSKFNLIQLNTSGKEISRNELQGLAPDYLFKYENTFAFIDPFETNQIGILEDLTNFEIYDFSFEKEKNIDFYISNVAQIDENIYFLVYYDYPDKYEYLLFEYNITDNTMNEIEIPFGNNIWDEKMLITEKKELLLCFFIEDEKDNSSQIEIHKLNGNKIIQQFKTEKFNSILSIIEFNQLKNKNYVMVLEEEEVISNSEYYSYNKKVDKGNIHYFIIAPDFNITQSGFLKRKAIWELSIQQYGNETSDLGLYKASMVDASQRSKRFTSVSCLIEENNIYITIPTKDNLSIVEINSNGKAKFYNNIFKHDEGFSNLYFSPNLSFKLQNKMKFGFVFTTTGAAALVDLTNKLYLVNIDN